MTDVGHQWDVKGPPLMIFSHANYVALGMAITGCWPVDLPAAVVLRWQMYPLHC